MEILNNIEWYFYNDEVKNATIRDTGKKITKTHLKTIVFKNSVNETVKFCLPLNDDLTCTETIELQCPIDVEQILTMIKDFYNKPLTQETINKAFEKNQEMKAEWFEYINDRFDGDLSKLTNYHLFDDESATPDFCGINLMEDSDEYFVGIGPE
jgi:hypothetical protein